MDPMREYLWGQGPIKSTRVSSVEKLICSGCTKYLLRFGSQCVLGVRDNNISFTFRMKKQSIITANQREESSTQAPCVEQKGCCRFPFSIKKKLFIEMCEIILDFQQNSKRVNRTVGPHHNSATDNRYEFTSAALFLVQLFAKTRREIRVRRMT